MSERGPIVSDFKFFLYFWTAMGSLIFCLIRFGFLGAN
jgi:hypothetical protein